MRSGKMEETYLPSARLPRSLWGFVPVLRQNLVWFYGIRLTAHREGVPVELK